jgi:hypothetical protein
MKCPKCGSDKIYVHSQKQTGWKRGCLGGCLFLPLALLAFTKKNKVEKVCLECNNKF